MYPWYTYVDFYFEKGIIDQDPNYLLRPNGWTGKCNGLVNTVVRCRIPNNPSKNFAKFFPSGVPSYRAVLKLSLVFDPRDTAQIWADASTWKWSANPAVCILDYLTNARAMHIAQARIDLPSFIAMANLCDQPVALGAKGIAADNLAAGTGAEARYTLWGMYSLDEEPKDVLNRLLKTCDGELYMTAAGSVALRGGQWTTPTVTITADMVLGVEAHRGRDKMSKYNQLKIRYMSVFNQYQVVEGDPWDDVAAQAASSEVLPEDFDGSYVPSYTQCLRLAKIQMAKDNPDWILTVTASIAGLNALGERIITFVFPDLGINRTCFVNSFDMAEDGASCKIGLGTLDASAYEWSTAEEGNAAAAYIAPVLSAVVPAEPTNLVLSLNRISTGDGGYVSTLQAQIDPPADVTLGMVAQYRLDGTTTWSDMSVDNSTYTATSPPVSDQQTYDVQVALQTYGGNEGAFASGTIQVVADATSPGAPTNFTAQKNADGSATLAWTNPNASNYFATKVYAGTTSNMNQASVITTSYGSAGGQRSTSVQPQSGANFYWVKAVNRSNVGDSAGPLEIDL